MQNKIMMFVMPVMMGVFTVGYPLGVGIYWITSSVFQVVQQALLNRSSGIGLFSKKGPDVIETKKEPR
jgi:membrane protein insertase Oxa1/YidC/SpoIIIJ